jgi:hypothetical protein
MEEAEKVDYQAVEEVEGVRSPQNLALGEEAEVVVVGLALCRDLRRMISVVIDNRCRETSMVHGTPK